MYLIRPRPQLQESLSSWRQRSGIANGFRIYPRPGGRRGSTDPDRLPKELEIEWIENHLVIEINTLNALTLDDWSPVFTDFRNRSSQRHWILPLGKDRAPNRSGPMVCPLCLGNDKESYYRLYWRFAFITHCPVHHSLLIDRCPKCSATLWPATRPARNTKTYFALYQCHQCGHDLTTSPPGYSMPTDQQAPLEGLLETKPVPINLGKVDHWADLLDCIWSLSQLLMRRRSFHLWEQLPGNFSVPKIETRSGPKIQSIEGLRVDVRFRVIQAVLWLLEAWPGRFVTTCQSAKLSRKDFTSSRAYHPPWLQEVIDSHLTHHQRDQVSFGQIDQAVDELKRTGDSVSKSAVRRKLGVSESRAVDALLGQRRHATFKELLRLCGEFEKDLKYTPDSRDQKATLIRDYLIFLLSVLSDTSIDHICSLTQMEVSLLIENSSVEIVSNNCMFVIFKRTREISKIYKESVYPKFYKEKISGNYWLIGREGKEYAGHAARERIAKMIRRCLPRDLWNSADAFLHSLHENPPQGRRAKRDIYSEYQKSLF